MQGRSFGYILKVPAEANPRLMPPEKRYRVVIAEDHTLFRDGLKALLSFEPDFEVVGEAADGQEAIAQHRGVDPRPRLVGSLDATRRRHDRY